MDTTATDLAEFKAGLASRTVGQLRADLADGLKLTADSLARVAAVWAELEARGEDLSDLRHGLGRNVALIASGRLAPEAVVAFAGKPSVLRAIDGLPLGEQRRLAAGGKVELVTPDDRRSSVEVPVASIPPRLLGVVFGEGEIRQPAEQRLRLRAKAAPPAKPERKYRVKYDPEKGEVKVGGMSVPVAEVLRALGESFGPARPISEDLLVPTDYAAATAKLRPEEREALLAMCKRTGIEEPALIRLALRACGLLDNR